MGKLLSALGALEVPFQLKISPPPNPQVLNHLAPNAQVLRGAIQHRTKAPPSHLERRRMSWIRVLAQCTKSKHAGPSCAVLRPGSSPGCLTCS